MYNYNPTFNPYNNQINPLIQPRQQANIGITWVQGIEGAKAYQIMPNSNIVLMDSDNDGMMYIKVSDNVGMCTLRQFKYEELKDALPAAKDIDLSNYVTKDELKEILSKIGGTSNGKQSIPAAKQSTTTDK